MGEMPPPAPARLRRIASWPHTLRVAGGQALSRLSDLVVPPLCHGCHEPMTAHNTLCATCWGGIDFIRAPLCDRLGIPMPFDTGGPMVSAAAVADPPVFDRARAVAHHTGTMRTLIHDLKFHDRDDLVQLLSGWLVETGDELLGDADVIVPVPLGRLRLMKRRFNQAALLARDVSRRTGVPYDPLSLVRTRRTTSQVGLTRLQRADNVRGAFAVPPARLGRIAGRKVLLIDDVMTTGATAAACAKGLRNAGAERVDVLTLALVTDYVLVPV
jgi:ComF family protein